MGGDHAELIRRAVDAGALDVLEESLGGVVDSFARSTAAPDDALARFRTHASALRVAAIRTGTAEAIRRVQDDESALLRVTENLKHLGKSREEQEANAAQLQAALDGAMDLGVRLLPVLIGLAA